MPKKRCYPRLYQSWRFWKEVNDIIVSHKLRLDSIKRGVSELDPEFEEFFLDVMAPIENDARKAMIEEAKKLPPWEWMITIKGLKSGSIGAKVLALIDDIRIPTNVSKLWVYSGYGVTDGQADKNRKGVSSRFNKALKSALWEVASQFIRQKTPLYYDLYLEEKKRQRGLHPEPVDGKYTDGHIHNMARRKMTKIFIYHLWFVWRSVEGLPTSNPWVIDHGRHTDLIPPPNWEG